MDSTANNHNSQKEVTDIPQGKMYVKVYSPYKNYFAGIADSLSAVNDTGPFDILPGHHRFLTLLSAGDIIIRRDGSDDKVVPIVNGVMYVVSGKITVFLDI